MILAGDWTSGLIGASEAAQDAVAHAVALSHPKPGWAVLMFQDASDEHWRSFLTQVPQEELDRGVSVEDMTYEPLGFLSGTFKWSQQRLATVDKEGFAVVIRDAQQASRANLGTLASGATSFMTNVDQVSLDGEGLFRLPVNGHPVLWIPGGAK